jgi:hypothetical protein
MFLSVKNVTPTCTVAKICFTSVKINYIISELRATLNGKVFVLPTFEIEDDVEIPEDKSGLERLLDNGMATFPFPEFSHRFPDDEMWTGEEEEKGTRAGKFYFIFLKFECVENIF